MGNIVLLEQEEDVRLAAVIVARNRNIILKVYQDYNEYKNYMEKDDTVCSSNEIECRQYNFIYIKKPYTADELMQVIGREHR